MYLPNLTLLSKVFTLESDLHRKGGSLLLKVGIFSEVHHLKTFCN